MTRGADAGRVGPVDGASNLPPDDTGEAIGLPPSGLTITFGFGPSLFRDADGKDRFGLADRQPEALRELPHFPADNLDPDRSYGDLCVQACANDPQVAVHAIRNLARIGFGTVAVRWSQLGFGRTSTTSVTQDTPRNLFGFKDGTANIKAEETSDLEKHVWVGDGDDAEAEWLAGGSYLVARRFNMTIEVWDRQPLGDQEAFVGRTKGTGAPLSGGERVRRPRLRPCRAATTPVIAPDAHVRLVHPDFNDGARMLRRGYNFVDGTDALGGLTPGCSSSPTSATRTRTSSRSRTGWRRQDALMEYLKVTGSALFAVPPGIGRASTSASRSSPDVSGLARRGRRSRAIAARSLRSVGPIRTAGFRRRMLGCCVALAARRSVDRATTAGLGPPGAASPPAARRQAGAAADLLVGGPGPEHVGGADERRARWRRQRRAARAARST